MAGFHFYCFAILALFGFLNILQNELAAAIRIEPGPTLSPQADDSSPQRQPRQRRHSFGWRRFSSPVRVLLAHYSHLASRSALLLSQQLESEALILVRHSFRWPTDAYLLQIRRVMNSLKSLLSRRSKSEAEEELVTIEEAALKKIDCFSLGSPEEKAIKAIERVCSKLRNVSLHRNCAFFARHIAERFASIQECLDQDEAAAPADKLRCFKEHYLFLVHPYLRQTEGAALRDGVAGARDWFKNLRFQPPSNTQPSVRIEDPVGQAMRELRESTKASVDSHFILTVDLLIKRTVAPRGLRRRISAFWGNVKGRFPRQPVQRIPDAETLLNEGGEIFASTPPRPDPLAVRLATHMLITNASCPSSSSRSSETVLLKGKPRRVKLQKMLEAAVVVFIENLFDTRSCANDESKADEPTCRLLKEYDEYAQSISMPYGGEGEEEPTGSESELLESPQKNDWEGHVGSVQTPEEGSMDMQGAESTGGEEEALEGSQAFADISEPARDEEANEYSGRANMEGAQSRLRMRRAALAAIANAVAVARLSLRSETLPFHVLRFLLKNASLRRFIVRGFIGFMGRELLSLEGLALLGGFGSHGLLLFELYMEALIQLATGRPRLGKISASLANSVAEEGSRFAGADQGQEHSAVFLQDEIPRAKVRRAILALGAPPTERVSGQLAVSLYVLKYSLLLFLILTLGTTGSIVAFAVALVYTIFLVLKTLALIFVGLVVHPIKRRFQGRGSPASAPSDEAATANQ
ncbi:hypothetical protein Efla_004370 [Eimeria flavescens]